MPLFVSLRGQSMRCPECAYQGPCEVVLSCRTTIRNAHNTGERDIIYAWHPWVGRRVEILRVFGRGGVSTVRCRLAGRAQCLPLEVPSWMFERSPAAHLQLLLCIDAPQLLVVHFVALPLDHYMDTTVAKPPPLFGNTFNRIAQISIINPSRLIPHR